MRGCLRGASRRTRSDGSDVVADWLADTGLERRETGVLAKDPPLTLFLMLEAEADADGQTLGALGSIIMGETFAAGMDFAIPETEAVAEARARRSSTAPYPPGWPRSSASCSTTTSLPTARGSAPAKRKPKRAAPRPTSSEGPSTMFDHHKREKPTIPLIEVADYIEMGRLVVQWATDENSRPEDVAELVKQLDGIAVVPESHQGARVRAGHPREAVIRLPAKDMIQETETVLADPMANGEYYRCPSSMPITIIPGSAR